MHNIDIDNLFTSKKYKLSEKRLVLIGIVQQTIYSKEFFNKNSNLSEYISTFEKMYKLDKDEKFKDYLYNSRTLLAARVCRIILEKDNLEVEKKLMDFHIEIYDKASLIQENKKTKARKNSSLLKDIINNRSIGTEYDE